MNKQKGLFVTGLLLVLYLMFFSSCALIGEKKQTINTDSLQKDSVTSYESDWGYSGDKAPENWEKLNPAYSLCGGELQSPIDIKAAFPDNTLGALKLHFSQLQELKIENNGHSIEIFAVDGAKLIFDQSEYILQKIHFHCPSEHLVKSQAYNMEIHLVFKNNQRYAVVGIFVKEGANNLFFTKLIDHLPNKPGSISTDKVSFSANELIPTKSDYYYYRGSLTTPPCTEGVEWFVFHYPIEASIDQIERLKAVMPLKNARPINPLNGRLVKKYVVR